MTPNTRKPNETFDEYKARLKATQIADKIYNQSKTFWDSSKYGTYRKYNL